MIHFDDHIFQMGWFNHQLVLGVSYISIVCESVCDLFYGASIWVFPKIGVPPNHPYVHRVFPYKPFIFGVPVFLG